MGNTVKGRFQSIPRYENISLLTETHLVHIVAWNKNNSRNTHKVAADGQYYYVQLWLCTKATFWTLWTYRKVPVRQLDFWTLTSFPVLSGRIRSNLDTEITEHYFKMFCLWLWRQRQRCRACPKNVEVNILRWFSALWFVLFTRVWTPLSIVLFDSLINSFKVLLNKKCTWELPPFLPRSNWPTSEFRQVWERIKPLKSDFHQLHSNHCARWIMKWLKEMLHSKSLALWSHLALRLPYLLSFDPRHLSGCDHALSQVMYILLILGALGSFNEQGAGGQS